MNLDTLQEKLAQRLCVIITNYGDDSIALIQWALESPLLQYQRENKQLKVVYIDTGFSANSWAERIAEGRAYVEKAGLEAIHLISDIPFQDAVMGRGEFPSTKFQWCSTVLKGLPLLDWLDKVDPACRSIILSAKRRETLIPPFDNLPEWIEKSEHFNDRSQWHPLIEKNEDARDSLLERAHFIPLGHRSLECDPCINSSVKTLVCLAKKDILKVKILEETLGSPMFSKEDFERLASCDSTETTNFEFLARGEGIEAVVNAAKHCVTQEEKRVVSSDLTLFYRGCGNPFSCGM